jgi:hypothetical protein
MSRYTTTWFAIKYLLEPNTVFNTEMDVDLTDSTYLTTLKVDGSLTSTNNSAIGYVLSDDLLDKLIKKYLDQRHGIDSSPLLFDNRIKRQIINTRINDWYLFKLKDKSQYVLACSDTTTRDISETGVPFIVFSTSTNFSKALNSETQPFMVQSMKPDSKALPKKGGRKRKSTKKSMKKRSNKKNRTKYHRRKFMNY